VWHAGNKPISGVACESFAVLIMLCLLRYQNFLRNKAYDMGTQPYNQPVTHWVGVGSERSTDNVGNVKISIEYHGNSSYLYIESVVGDADAIDAAS